jgi:hypothetical protein
MPGNNTQQGISGKQVNSVYQPNLYQANSNMMNGMNIQRT